MLFKGIFWGLIISLPLWAIIYFASCQVVVNKGISYQDWKAKYNIHEIPVKELLERYGIKELHEN